MKELMLQEVIETKIFLIRGKKTMLDKDLAFLYGVLTKRLLEQVNRNKDRFPLDFMFQMTKAEFELLRSHFATSSRGGRRYLPYVFTENGVAMLSSVLKSKRAIWANIQIMRTFTKLRELLASHAELKRKIEEMEGKYDKQFTIVFDAIKKLVAPPETPKKKIGFLTDA